MTDKKRSAPPEARAILDACEARIDPAVSRRTLVVAIMVAATVLYFLAAYFLTVTHRDTAPRDKNAAEVIGPFQLINGFWVTRVWIVAKEGPITIYENGVSLGHAHDVYKDHSRDFVTKGLRWEFVEFYSASDPNTNGRYYWAVRN